MNSDSPNFSRRQMFFKSAARMSAVAGIAGLPARSVRAQTATGAPVSPGLGQGCGGGLGRLLQPGGELPVQQILETFETNNHVIMNGVLLVSLGRLDLNVVGPNGHVFYPSFAPNHKFFFEPLDNGQAFMNAEFTFVPQELPAAINAVLFSRLQLMAEHQHYIGENPQTFHFHFRGVGQPVDVAEWAMGVVKATGTPLPQIIPPNLTTPLPYQKMAEIIGGNASIQPHGVVTIMKTRPYPKYFIEAGAVLKPQVNLLQKIAFEPLDSSGSTTNCGADFILLSGEVNPALNTARSLGFEVHCLYNQQTDIEPQPYFSHCLQAGDARTLASKVRQVLDVIDTVPATSPTCPQSAMPGKSNGHG